MTKPTPPADRAISVTKGDGEREALDLEKLKRSLARSGASHPMIERIASRVGAQAEDGISTEKLYKIAFRLLRKERRHLAARYSLKRSVMQLGPSGFPFERLIAALLAVDGWRTEVGVSLKGAVFHEIDVLAHYPMASAVAAPRRLLVECKHRSHPDAKCDVKTALYVSARARDLLGDLKHTRDQFWLVTNGRFTQDAIDYAKSVHLGLLGWDYPSSQPPSPFSAEPEPEDIYFTPSGPVQPEFNLPLRSLSQRITDTLAFPITCLTSLKLRQKHQLLEANIVLCRDLEANPNLLNQLRLAPSQVAEVRREIFDLLHPLSLEASPVSRA